MALIEQSGRRLPYLRRRVVPQLLGNDLMHRQVQPRIDRAVAEIDLLEALLKRTLEFGVLSTDRHRTDIWIDEILDAHAQGGEHLRIRDEALAIKIVAAARLTRHSRSMTGATAGSSSENGNVRSRLGAMA